MFLAVLISDLNQLTKRLSRLIFNALLGTKYFSSRHVAFFNVLSYHPWHGNVAMAIYSGSRHIAFLRKVEPAAGIIFRFLSSRLINF